VSAYLCHQTKLSVVSLTRLICLLQLAYFRRHPSAMPAVSVFLSLFFGGVCRAKLLNGCALLNDDDAPLSAALSHRVFVPVCVAYTSSLRPHTLVA